MYSGWSRVATDSWWLAAETWTVMGMRMMHLAAGDARAAREADRMVAEKVQALIDLQIAIATGGLGYSPLSVAGGTVKHYRRRVRANQRRLSRP